MYLHLIFHGTPRTSYNTNEANIIFENKIIFSYLRQMVKVMFPYFLTFWIINIKNKFLYHELLLNRSYHQMSSLSHVCFKDQILCNRLNFLTHLIF